MTFVSGFRRRICVSVSNPSVVPSGSGGRPRSRVTTAGSCRRSASIARDAVAGKHDLIAFVGPFELALQAFVVLDDQEDGELLVGHAIFRCGCAASSAAGTIDGEFGADARRAVDDQAAAHCGDQRARFERADAEAAGLGRREGLEQAVADEVAVHAGAMVGDGDADLVAGRSHPDGDRRRPASSPRRRSGSRWPTACSRASSVDHGPQVRRRQAASPHGRGAWPRSRPTGSCAAAAARSAGRAPGPAARGGRGARSSCRPSCAASRPCRRGTRDCRRAARRCARAATAG